MKTSLSLAGLSTAAGAFIQFVGVSGRERFPSWVLVGALTCTDEVTDPARLIGRGRNADVIWEAVDGGGGLSKLDGEFWYDEAGGEVGGVEWSKGPSEAETIDGPDCPV